MCRTLVALAVSGVLAVSIVPLLAADQPTPTSKRALLVGCTTYPDRSMNLSGPGNDVVLMRDLLMSRFGFRDQDIVTLSEAAGKKDLRPIRANIVREFQRLISTAKRGEQIVILLAGHGSQQVDDNPDDPDDRELDGLDEVFCPADVSSLDTNDSGTIANAIVDDEIRQWLHAIREQGASVWVIIDACHSGTMIRGNDQEIVRRIAPDRFVSAERLRQAAQLAAKNREATRGKGPVAESLGFAPQNSKAELGDVVAICAAQSTEPTVERPLPYDTPEAKYYGLLTFTMNQILTQATAPMTYAELVQRVQADYVGRGRIGPTPLIEGTAVHREVLGLREWPERSRFVLTRVAAKSWKLNAGVLHGLSKDSILAVFPPAGEANADQPLGAVTISSARMLDSVVEPCAFDKIPLNEQLPDGGRCEVVFRDLGIRRLKLAVEVFPANKESAQKTKQRIDDALKALAAAREALFEVVADRADADWLVLVEKSGAYLAPAQGWSSATDNDLIRKFGPIPTDKRMSEWLNENLRRIARAKSLLALSALGSERTRGGADVAVEVELLRFKGEDDAAGEVIRWDSSAPRLNVGDLVGFQVHNRSRFPVDVTFLVVDSEFGIQVFLPDRETSAATRIPPMKTLSPKKVDRFNVSQKTLGLEHLMTIAVKAQGQPLDFSFLSQPSLERTRGSDPAIDSPLGQILQNALFGRGQTRGLSRVEVSNHAFHLLSWQVIPKLEGNEAR